jgi:hypothetical protein
MSKIIPIKLNNLRKPITSHQLDPMWQDCFWKNMMVLHGQATKHTPIIILDVLETRFCLHLKVEPTQNRLVTNSYARDVNYVGPVAAFWSRTRQWLFWGFLSSSIRMLGYFDCDILVVAKFTGLAKLLILFWSKLLFQTVDLKVSLLPISASKSP